MAIACVARAAKDQRAVAHGKKHAERRKEKQKSGAGISQVSIGQTHTENRKGPVRKPHTTGSPEKPILRSISPVGERSEPAEAPLRPFLALRERAPFLGDAVITEVCDPDEAAAIRAACTLVSQHLRETIMRRGWARSPRSV